MKRARASSGQGMNALVVGASAGGGKAIQTLLSRLPSRLAVPVLIVQHLHASDDGGFCRMLGKATEMPVHEPFDKEPIQAGWVYTAPANYHMLVEPGLTISLSVDDRVTGSRPAIDLLFESAAQAWRERLTAVILTGANHDGAAGMCAVKSLGGVTFAQDPAEAEFPAMPRAAIEIGAVDHVLPIADIGDRLAGMIVRAESPATAAAPNSGD